MSTLAYRRPRGRFLALRFRRAGIGTYLVLLIALFGLLNYLLVSRIRSAET